MTPRVIVYVDGFNFYYGLKGVRWKKYYWLDIVKFFSLLLRPHQNLIEAKYFSAVPKDTGKQKRQDAFFAANKQTPGFKLYLGKFLRKTSTCRICGAARSIFEEKESDVRVATEMIADVVKDRCDITIIVSADSDLLPPIEFIKNYKPTQKVFVYFPPKRESASLARVSDAFVKLDRYEHVFAKAILAESIMDRKTGFEIKRPERWI